MSDAQPTGGGAPAAPYPEHRYRGIRVADTNESNERYTVRCVVLVDDQPLPMTDLAKRKSRSYEWGYGGSGPAALAHSLLAYEFGADEANRLNVHYQDFKWLVVAQLNHTGWTLTSTEIRAAVARLRERTS